MDCTSFDKDAWGFAVSNKGVCREDGQEHWIGDVACDCFTFAPDSKIAAFAGG
jgi:hypothetical protein